MDRTTLIFFVGLVTSALLWLLAVLVWAIWIQGYVERNGGKTAPFALTLLTGWGADRGLSPSKAPRCRAPADALVFTMLCMVSMSWHDWIY